MSNHIKNADAMEYNNIMKEAYDRYFKTLSKVGYINDCQTYKLLVCGFLTSLLDPFYSGFISEEDYNYLTDGITCLMGTSCLIPYKEYILMSEPVRYSLEDTEFRITEVTQLRDTESEVLRITEM